jgi:hypothetical protein
LTQTVITISRLHGSAGEQIGRQAAENLSIPFFGKAEIMQTAAQESGIALMHFYSSALRADMGPVFPILPGAPFAPPCATKSSRPRPPLSEALRAGAPASSSAAAPASFYATVFRCCAF